MATPALPSIAQARHLDHQGGRAVGIGVGAEVERVEGLRRVRGQHAEGCLAAAIDDRRAGMEAQEVPHLGMVEPLGQPDRRVAVGQGQQIGGCGGA
jgi:hypothetical protein